MITGPIFITGASRSGTALLRSILNNAKGVYLAGETHYFDDLRVRVGTGGTRLSAKEEQICLDYFLALTHRPYGHQGDPRQGSLDVRAVKARARELGGTADSMFQGYCETIARDQGATCWGEKTPRHIYRLPEIFAAFPNARAFCMVRDPRAVVASYRDWRNQGGFDLEKDPRHADALEDDRRRIRQSFHPLIASFLWRATVQAARTAREDFGTHRVYIQRYEDLVDHPEATVSDIMAWLDLANEPGLLDVPIHNSSFTQYDRDGGVTTAAVDRWREKLTVAEIALVQSACGESMAAVGYALEHADASLWSLAHGWGTLPMAGFRALSANKERMGSIPRYLARRVSILLPK